MTLEDMQDIVTEWLNEAPSATALDDAINEGVENLWKELVKVNPNRYLSLQPDTLVLAADIIPFDEVSPDSFVKYTALSLLCSKIYEYDAAADWGAKAEQELAGIRVIAERLKDRQEYIRPYRP